MLEITEELVAQAGKDKPAFHHFYTPVEMNAFEETVMLSLKEQPALLEEIEQIRQSSPDGYLVMLETALIGGTLAMTSKGSADLSVAGKGCYSPSRDILRSLISAFINDQGVRELAEYDPIVADKHVESFIRNVVVS